MIFRRIIIPIVKSNESLITAKKAIDIAKKLNIKILAIYVIKTKIFAGAIPPNHTYAYQSYGEIKHEQRENAHRFLNKIEKIGTNKNIDIKTILIEGDPEKKIFGEIEKDDLIIISNKKISTFDRVFLNSLSEKIIHNAPSTVMIVR